MADYRTITVRASLSQTVINGVAHFNSSIVKASASLSTPLSMTDLPVYEGQTEVEPDFVGITLKTARKAVLSDITVNPIQVESVSNPQGGKTVYIGGII